MLRRFLAPLLLALYFAAPAMAQDGEPAFDGVYVGGSFGYTVQNNDVGETIEMH